MEDRPKLYKNVGRKYKPSGVPKDLHAVHPVSSGAVNCLVTVDNVVRATTDLGTSQKLSLLMPLMNSSSQNHTTTTTTTNANANTNPTNATSNPLAKLQNTRHLFIRHYTKPLKFPMQAKKKYQILNSNGDCIYFAIEKSSTLNRLCFFRGACPFQLQLLSLKGEPIMEVKGRPGCKARAEIITASKEVLGSIVKTSSPCSPCFSLRNPDGIEILRIFGPEGSDCCCMWGDCGSEDFDVRLPDGKTAIGRISSEWEYTMEDLTGLFIPVKLDEHVMGLLLGALFLIDLNFYQGRKDVSCFGRCFATLLFFTFFLALLFVIAEK